MLSGNAGLAGLAGLAGAEGWLKDERSEMRLEAC